MMHYFIRFGFPVKSGRGYSTAGAKLPQFAKGETTLKSSHLPSPSVRQHFRKTNNKNPSQKEVMLTGCCISSCLLSEKSRGKDLCIWPSWFTDESFETERWPLAQNTHNTSLAELRPAPWPSESS